MFWWIVIGSGLLFIWTMYSLFMSRTPEVAFHSLKKYQTLEIRKYESHFRIKSKVNPDDSARTLKALMDYLDGENEQRLTIKWIAPILIEHNGAESEMSIVLPSQFTLSNLPKALDETIQFEEMPQKIMAVRMYSWFNAPWRFEHERKRLDEVLENKSIRIVSPPTEAIFQVNWILPWLCKYEVMVEVEYIND